MDRLAGVLCPLCGERGLSRALIGLRLSTRCKNCGARCRRPFISMPLMDVMLNIIYLAAFMAAFLLVVETRSVLPMIVYFGIVVLIESAMPVRPDLKDPLTRRVAKRREAKPDR